MLHAYIDVSCGAACPKLLVAITLEARAYQLPSQLGPYILADPPKTLRSNALYNQYFDDDADASAYLDSSPTAIFLNTHMAIGNHEFEIPILSHFVASHLNTLRCR